MKRIIVAALAFAFMALAFFDLVNFVSAGRQGLLLIAANVVPVLFPFFFISSLLAGLGFFSLCAPLLNPLCNRLYKTGGNAGGVFLVSLLSGYPTGARLIAELYQRGEISRSDAIRTATWTSTCSPAFIIGTVGAALCGSPTIGLIIFAAHALGALLNGLIYRGIQFPDNTDALKRPNLPHTRRNALLDNNPPIDEVLNTALYSSIQSILIVSGWIVLFFVATAQLQAVAALPHNMDVFVSSLLEMTTGVFRAGQKACVPILCAIVSFGGLSVAMQAQTFLKTFRMPLGFYFLYKLTHTVLAVLLCTVMVAVFL